MQSSHAECSNVLKMSLHIDDDCHSGSTCELIFQEDYLTIHPVQGEYFRVDLDTLAALITTHKKNMEDFTR